MRKSQFKLTGSIVGIFIGVLIGLGILSQTKKSQRSDIAMYAISAGIICGLIGGYQVGAKLDLATQIEQDLGIDRVVTEYFQSGRSWIASSKWADSKNINYLLLTGKNSNKELISQLNDDVIMNHAIQSGSKVNVEKYHRIACNHIFKILKEQYTVTKQTSG